MEKPGKKMPFFVKRKKEAPPVAEEPESASSTTCPKCGCEFDPNDPDAYEE